MIVEMGQQVRSKFVLPSGQSGHLFSDHFRDQTARWQTQGFIGLSGDDAGVSHRPRLLLKPAG
jgi:acyl-homoserine lactone acylase PvdQ